MNYPKTHKERAKELIDFFIITFYSLRVYIDDRDYTLGTRELNNHEQLELAKISAINCVDQIMKEYDPNQGGSDFISHYYYEDVKKAIENYGKDPY